MSIEILMPALSPTMTEGNLAKWMKKEGDKVKPGEVIAEIETDKATMEVEAVDEGIIGKIFVAEGAQNVAVNSVIAVLLEEGESTSVLDNYAPKTQSSSVSSDSPNLNMQTETAKTDSLKVNNSSVNASLDRVFASPLAKRIAQIENVDISKINGTGPHGRVIKSDVVEAMSNSKGSNAPASSNIIYGRDSAEYRVLPLTNMRKVIAKRLLESKQNIPHFYLNIECNIDKLLEARMEMNKLGEVNSLYKLSVNDFVIKATAQAMKAVPEANSSWDEGGIRLYNNIDISIAVAIDNGLITPVIKNADLKSLASISNEMKDLAKRARDGKLKPEEYQGGGLSISNLGMFGINQFNAIVNPPQSCIIAVGAAIKKPVVVKDQVTIGNIVNITLSCDHRSVDGAVGAKFLSSLKNFIENPVTMLI